MIPIWQLMIGVCMGLAVMVLTRPRPVGYVQERTARCKPRKEELKSKPGDDCIICVQKMTSDDMHYFPCKHAVHKGDCLESVKEHKGICPICEKTISASAVVEPLVFIGNS